MIENKLIKIIVYFKKDIAAHVIAGGAIEPTILLCPGRQILQFCKVRRFFDKGFLYKQLNSNKLKFVLYWH